MKNSIYGVLLFSSFALSLTTDLLADADTVNLGTGFNGAPSKTLNVKETSNADGTIYQVTQPYFLTQVTQFNKADTSCFSNTAGDLTFTSTNNQRLFFQNITSTAQGVAVSSTADGKTLTFSSLYLILYASPLVATGKGAVYSNSSVTIENCRDISFGFNKTTEKGAVIYCTKSAGGATAPTLTLTGNNQIHCVSNLSKSSGGAIYADNLVLSTGGATLFQGNVTESMGGAIAIGPNGNISLSADGGNLTFQRNLRSDPANNKNSIRSSIHLENNAKFLQLRAREDYTIEFCDPITSEGNANEKLVINASDGAARYNGTIVFSSDNYYTTSPLSKMSVFPQDLALADGSLILKDGVTFLAKSFDQSRASILLLGEGTTVQTTNNLNIKNLVLKLTSVQEPPALLSATADTARVDLQGPITLEVPDEIFFNQEALAKEISFDHLTISCKHLDNVVIDNTFEMPNSNMDNHRGYQGEWKTSWSEEIDPEGHVSPKKKMVLSWKPSGYIPFSGGTGEFTTSLVPNSLWNLFLDTRFSQQAIETTAQSSPTGIWSGAISNFSRKYASKQNHGFCHQSCGYVLGGQILTPKEDILGVSLCQQFGNSRDFARAKARDKFFSGSMYARHSRRLLPIMRFLAGTSTFRPKILLQVPRDFPINFDALVSYSFNKNHMKVKYSDKTKTTSVWDTYGYSAQVGSSLSFALDASHSFFQTLSPFIKLHWLHAQQAQFQEEGLKRRAFSNSSLKNLSLPIGLKIQGQSLHHLSYEFTGMYIADVYRRNPKSVTSLLSGGLLPWTTTATNLPRQGALFQGSGNLVLTSHINIFAQGTVERRSSSYSYNLDLGSKVLF
ncbi:polymorphic outer membrane protein middle domain-containing protein [Chlamydia vaughanii]|uniref:polymorphic outer membrane protein middle domain-containing protein n=1 Tax=Chlamydia vaughanii TaxID=3112552 RepID=UPI0032B1619F